MLPTTGRFKDITCPFLETSCDRPYCHFSHKKKNIESLNSSTSVAEVPTYNPTPKSQLLNTKSHIPISYVPDIVSRTDRKNSRFNLVFENSRQIQPVYKPTPLSILSSNSKTADSQDQGSENYIKQLSKKEKQEYDPESCDINFEALTTEFDLIDEIINTSESDDYKKESQNDSLNDNKNDNVVKPEKKRNDNVHKSKSEPSSEERKKHKNDKQKKEDSTSKTKRSNDKHEKDEKKHKHHKKSDKNEKHKSSKSKDEKSDKTRSKSRKENETSKHKSKTKNREKTETKKEESLDKKEEKQKSKETKISNICISDNESNEMYGDIDNNMFDDELFDNEEDDDVIKECYKIFNEYKPTEPQLEPQEQHQKSPNIVESSYVPTSKKRIAHDKAENTISRVTVSKPKSSPNPALVMANRIKEARLAQAANEHKNLMAEMNRQELISHTKEEQRNHENKIQRQGLKRPTDKISNGSSKLMKVSSDSKLSNYSKSIIKPSTSSSLIDDILAGRNTTSNKPRKIAPAMNVNSIQRAKAKLDEIVKQRAVSQMKTPSQTFGKGSKRIAHVPEFSLSDIPDVLEAEKSKLPVNVRTRYLTMIADECVKLYLTKNDAYQRALKEELKCYERCSVLTTYRNSAMLAVNRLRKEVQDMEKSGQGPLSAEAESLNSGDIHEQLKGRKLHKNISEYLLTEEELKMHGYPREGRVPGVAAIYSDKLNKNTNLNLNERRCCRCAKTYRVDRDGFSTYEEECVYHPLKKRTLRGESIYLCCKTPDETGCVTAPSHVSDTPTLGEYDLEGYQKTFPPENDNDPRSYAVYALDCEMCYTTKGLELTRVTVVNSECKTVYETLVKPLNPIIDYNTRFSGITKEQMERTATTILQVQANILHLCNSKTILIGHSLESDMRALKIIHDSVVDTAILFPHKMGLPHKRALRVLASEYLKKIIQNDVSGHDSAEDALTCMELVLWKIKEELKGRGIKS